MTPAQQDAIRRILDIMSEHFETGLVAVECELDDKTSEVQCVCHGRYTAVVGLSELVRSRFHEAQMKSVQE